MDMKGLTERYVPPETRFIPRPGERGYGYWNRYIHAHLTRFYCFHEMPGGRSGGSEDGGAVTVGI